MVKDLLSLKQILKVFTEPNQEYAMENSEALSFWQNVNKTLKRSEDEKNILNQLPKSNLNCFFF